MSFYDKFVNSITWCNTNQKNSKMLPALYPYSRRDVDEEAVLPFQQGFLAFLQPCPCAHYPLRLAVTQFN